MATIVIVRRVHLATSEMTASVVKIVRAIGTSKGRQISYYGSNFKLSLAARDSHNFKV